MKIAEEIIKPENSLNIPREDLPQVPANKFYDFLDSLDNTNFESVEVEARDLKPIQSELDTDKADKIWAENAYSNMPLLISKDNYIIDGHHRWFAVLRNAPAKKIKCVKMDANVKDCINIVNNCKVSLNKDIFDNTI